MVVAELKTKVEKYETKASRCEQQARAATDKAEQTFYRGAGRLLRQPGNRFSEDPREAIDRIGSVRPVAWMSEAISGAVSAELSRVSLTLIRATYCALSIFCQWQPGSRCPAARAGRSGNRYKCRAGRSNPRSRRRRSRSPGSAPPRRRQLVAAPDRRPTEQLRHAYPTRTSGHQTVTTFFPKRRYRPDRTALGWRFPEARVLR